MGGTQRAVAKTNLPGCINKDIQLVLYTRHAEPWLVIPCQQAELFLIIKPFNELGIFKRSKDGLWSSYLTFLCRF